MHRSRFIPHRPRAWFVNTEKPHTPVDEPTKACNAFFIGRDKKGNGTKDGNGRTNQRLCQGDGQKEWYQDHDFLFKQFEKGSIMIL